MHYSDHAKMKALEHRELIHSTLMKCEIVFMCNKVNKPIQKNVKIYSQYIKLVAPHGSEITPNYSNELLLEFEFHNTKLIPREHKKLTNLS